MNKSLISKIDMLYESMGISNTISILAIDCNCEFGKTALILVLQYHIDYLQNAIAFNHNEVRDKKMIQENAVHGLKLNFCSETKGMMQKELLSTQNYMIQVHIEVIEWLLECVYNVYENTQNPIMDKIYKVCSRNIDMIKHALNAITKLLNDSTSGNIDETILQDPELNAVFNTPGFGFHYMKQIEELVDKNHKRQVEVEHEQPAEAKNPKKKTRRSSLHIDTNR